MPRFRTGALIGLALLVGTLSPAGAQAPARRVGQVAPAGPLFPKDAALRFERYSVDQGLSQSGVRSLAQDRHGFLWIGTQDGLNKFDGHDFTVYTHDPAEPRSLPNNVVTALHVARDGTLWVGTHGGLAKLVGIPSRLDRDGRPLEQSAIRSGAQPRDQAVFVTYVPHPRSPGSPATDPIRAIADDEEGNLWIGTPFGLDRLDPASGVFTHVDHRSAARPGRDQGINAILVEGDVVRAATRRGLIRFEASSGTMSRPLEEMDSAPAITRVLRTRSGQLWVAGEGGFGRFDEDTRSLSLQLPDPSRPPQDGHNAVTSFLEDRKGVIWAGTGTGGLVRYDPGTGDLTRYRHDPADPTSLGRAEVFALIEDRTGILWVGTGQGGLNKTVRGAPVFVSVRHDPADPASLSHDYVTGISEDPSGDIWIGTGGGGLNRLDRKTGRFHAYHWDPGDPRSLSDDYVRGVLVDREGYVWATADDALNLLAPGEESFSVFRPDPTELGGVTAMVVVYEDRAARLWVGSGLRGRTGALLRFDRDTESFEGFALPEAHGSVNVQVIREDRSGTLWLGTEQGGLYAYDPTTQRLEHYAYEPADPTTLRNATVQSIYQDSRGDLWIGTRGGGLSRLDPAGHGFRHYSQADGLANDVVYGIVEDRYGLLWLSTNRGLSRFGPASGVFRNYDVTDGLQSNEFNRWAYLVASDGTIFFGGINGLTAFRPGSLAGATDPPPVALTSVSVRNQVVAMGKAAAELDRIVLPASRNFFSVEYVALDFGNPTHNRYAYRLEGFDDDWIQAGPRRYARYTNVGPGDYEFRLRAENDEGVWNEEGLSLAVTVLPPFWASWPFILLMVAAGASIVFALYRYRVSHLIRLERTRTRIARDLHDDLSATLSSISFFAHAMRKQVEGVGEASKLLGLIMSSAGEAKETIQDIVWSINPEHDSWESLLAHCRRYASDLLESREIEYHIEIPRTARVKPLSAEQRQDFWLTYKELLTNAIRHARCSTMYIRLSFPGGAVRLDMSDDGIGFDEDAVAAGHGLRNVRARAARMGASLDLRTSPGAGTHWRMEFRA